MAFDSETVEAGYVEQSPPRCDFYGTCAERKCDGDGFIRCKVRMRGVVFNRLEGEYRKIKSKNSESSKSLCWGFSLLEKRASGSGIALPQ